MTRMGEVLSGDQTAHLNYNWRVVGQTSLSYYLNHTGAHFSYAVSSMQELNLTIYEKLPD